MDNFYLCDYVFIINALHCVTLRYTALDINDIDKNFKMKIISLVC